MKIFAKLFSLFFIGFILTGCAPSNVPLPDSFWQDNKQSITIVTVKAPTPGLSQEGMLGVLNYAINSGINSDLDKYLAQADLAWYNALPNDFATKMRKHDINVKIYGNKLASSPSNYASLKGQINTDKVLILRLVGYGAERQYNGSIPMGKPKGYCELTGDLVDLNTNKVLWHYNASISEPINGEWDQPPAYPNLTAAMKQAVAVAQDELLDSFFSGN
jgi:hypothetical protein